ncbi:MAG: alpha/beta fold hydrolase, partial [Candidatus Woesearchaeota archaeon]
KCKGVIYISGMGMQNNSDWAEEFNANSQKLDEPEFSLPEDLNINYDVLNKGLRSFNEYIKKPMLFKDISMLDLPVLIIYGADDIRPMWPAKQLANLLPHCMFKLFERTAHFIWEDRPNAFKETIFNWLDTIKTN